MPSAELDEVTDALADVGIPGLTVTEVRRFGPGCRRHHVHRGKSYVVDFVLKVKVEVVVPDEVVPTVLEALEASPDGQADNDRSVLVFDVVEAVRIRTGERGEEAIGVSAPSVVDLVPRAPQPRRLNLERGPRLARVKAP